jgi:hypothetical protein
MIGDDDLSRRFGYHAPPNQATIDAHQTIRTVLHDAAQTIDQLVPDGREKSLAVTHLEEAMFWANGAIARSGGVPDTTTKES